VLRGGRLAKLVDVLDASGQAGQVLKMKAGMIAEGRRLGGESIQTIQRPCHKPVSLALALRLRRLQPIAQRHQLIHLRDDAVLFAEWRDCHEDSRQRLLIDFWHRQAIVFLDGLRYECRGQHVFVQILPIHKRWNRVRRVTDAIEMREELRRVHRSRASSRIALS
jgi:hypothetical protein